MQVYVGSDLRIRAKKYSYSPMLLVNWSSGLRNKSYFTSSLSIHLSLVKNLHIYSSQVTSNLMSTPNSVYRYLTHKLPIVSPGSCMVCQHLFLVRWTVYYSNKNSWCTIYPFQFSSFFRTKWMVQYLFVSVIASGQDIDLFRKYDSWPAIYLYFVSVINGWPIMLVYRTWSWTVGRSCIPVPNKNTMLRVFPGWFRGLKTVTVVLMISVDYNNG